LSLNGRREAFAELVCRHQEVVIAYLLHQVRDAAIAEDLLQETFLRAYRCLDGCRQPEHFRSWLIGIARNACREWRRSRRLALPVPPSELEEAAFESGDTSEDRETPLALRNALRELSPDVAEVVEMKYLKGMSAKEIADALGRPLGTITGWLSKAYEQLRERLMPIWERNQ
jgi:RNA polymerase sigma-70 factor (ECF subfamily)